MSTFRETFIDKVHAIIRERGAHEGLVAAVYEAAKESGYVILTAERYKALNESDATLCRLEAAGVDNWEGYSNAFEDDEEEDE